MLTTADESVTQPENPQTRAAASADVRVPVPPTRYRARDVARLPSIEHEYTLSQLELGGGVGLPSVARVRLPSAQVLALAAAAAAVTWADGLDWTPDRVLLVFLPPALVLRRARHYLLDFVPFALLRLLWIR